MSRLNLPLLLPGFEVDTTAAWVLQECPSFFLPLALTAEAWSDTNWAQRVLLGAFILHYFQRQTKKRTRRDSEVTNSARNMYWNIVCH